MMHGNFLTGLEKRSIRHFHGFCGSGGGGRGFNKGHARVGRMVAEPICVGGFDIDPAAARDFHRMTGTAATVMDAFSREQYIAFNGREPPRGWREVTPVDVRRAAGSQAPHVVFLSSPCKGLSGLLPEAKSRTQKYVALNALTVRGVWLMLEAWRDDPPELLIFENVPRLMSRGRPLVEQIVALFHAYGYAVATSVHDCGELGGLAQSRKRCLIVARHLEKVPNMLYEPPRRPLRAVGDVLRHLPLPGDPAAGPMHRIPRLAWKTWVRLAFVRAGGDWRSLNDLAVQDGVLRDYLVVPCSQEGSGGYGVRSWHEPTGTIAGRSGPTNGAFSVADPRAKAAAAQYQQYGVLRWSESCGALTSQAAPGGGAFSVADVRVQQVRHNNAFRVVRCGDHSLAVTAGMGACGGCLADPRSGLASDRGAYLTGGHYGVVPWHGTAGALSAAASHDNGRWSVADPRVAGDVAGIALAPSWQPPAPDEQLAAVIVAEDGTWHRPFTTLDKAALQSFFDPEDPAEMAVFTLDGASDSAHCERIGNGVPPAAAAAMANEMYRTLLLSWAGDDSFQLSDTPVWVRPLIAGLSLDHAGLA